MLRMDDTLETHRRFEALLQSTLNQKLATLDADVPHPSGVVGLHSGLGFARAVAGIPQTPSEPPQPGRVVDGAGHDRPIYRGLLVYAWLRTMEIGQLMRTERLGMWCQSLEAAVSAPTGDAHALTGWNALALYVAAGLLGRDDWFALSAQAFEGLAEEQQPSGALFRHASSVNPETRWYDELTLLHAMSSYAVSAQDRRIEAAVHRATEFHFRETQPDHATHQPWALFAFLSNPDTRPQAGEILHTATMRTFRNLDAISLLLLADALWCLRLTLGVSRP
jgi:hypothetical protein